MIRFVRARRSIAAWLALGGALAATLVGWQAAERFAVADRGEEFEGRAVRLSSAIQTRMEVYIVALRAAAAFLDLSSEPTRAGWRNYVGRLNIVAYYPGIQGMGFTVALAPADIARHSEAVRAEGFFDYRVWPEGQRAQYSAILYLEPFDWRNQRALGYDMMSEPVRRAAMERSRDTGEPAASGKVELVQETDVAPQAGFLIYVPVYRYGVLPPTLAERRQLLRGWVYSPFRADDLMQGIYGAESPDIHIRVYDGQSAEPAALLHDSAAAGSSSRLAPSPLFTRTVPITVGARPWTIVLSSLPAFEAGIDQRLPTIVLAGGILGSILLFLAIAAMTARRQLLVDSYTAAQRGLEEKEVLLREVHHRVKNSLQIVVSMLTLQSLKADDARVRGELERAMARVRAVAKIHERLYGSSDVGHVEFASYLRGLCSDLQETAPEYALRVDATPYELETEQAVPLGLICVELITNAIKHANAPEHRRAIDIRFGPADSGELELSVRDYGTGVADGFSLEQSRSSLGIRTMQAFALQLNAGLSFEDAQPGTRWRLSLLGRGDGSTPAAGGGEPVLASTARRSGTQSPGGAVLHSPGRGDGTP